MILIQSSVIGRCNYDPCALLVSHDIVLDHCHRDILGILTAFWRLASALDIGGAFYYFWVAKGVVATLLRAWALG